MAEWSVEQVLQAAQIPFTYWDQAKPTWPALYKHMKQYGFGDKLNLIAAIGTIAHETAHRFYPIHEFGTPANWSRYSGGSNYAGRGLIQITHDYNYKKYGDKLGIDLLGNPDLALDLDISCRIFCEYWKDHGINLMAARQDWQSVRQAVYGGYDPVGIGVIQAVYNSLR